MRLTHRMVGLAVASVVAAGFAGTVAAAPSDTPNGQTGACNMVNAFHGGSGGGIETAWGTASPTGIDGMFNAVAQSGGSCGG
jgi:hypothetical protein